MVDFNIDRILELTKALVADTPKILEEPLGPGDRCLTAKQLVNALQNGLSNKELEHLAVCDVCRNNLASLATVPLKSDRSFVAQCLRKTEGDRWFRFLSLPNIVAEGMNALGSAIRITRRPEPVPAFVSCEDPAFEVSDPSTHRLTVTCSLMPAIERRRLLEIDSGSLRLGGAILAEKVSHQEPVDVDKDGQPDFVRVTFEDAHLSRRVRRAIEQGHRVIDTVQLTGRLKGESWGFLGRARIEFKGGGHEL